MRLADGPQRIEAELRSLGECAGISPEPSYPSGWMSGSRLLLRREFTPDHAQLECGDVEGAYPAWAFGGEPLVANEEKIGVATLPDFEGDAVIEVRLTAIQEVPDDVGVLIHDGIIRLSGDDAEGGTSLGGDLERVRLG
jgi:hypothetical protein